MAEPLRVGEDVDLGDLLAADREGHDRKRLSFEHADQPSGAVDKHREPEQTEALEALGATSHLLRASELDRPASQQRTAVASEDHLRVEDSDEPVEVTVACRRNKGLDDTSLNFRVGMVPVRPRCSRSASSKVRRPSSGTARS